jgi:mannose-1-phosphate guanylyltransferase
MIKELKKHLPNLIPLFSTFDTHYPPDPNELQRVFSVTENISIDYGMLENATCTAVMKTTMPWEDIGDFNSLKHVLQCDENGNFFKVNDNKVSSIDSNDNIILTDKKIALIGVHDIAVVDTPDVLFICKRSDTSKIKNLLENIESSYK